MNHGVPDAPACVPAGHEEAPRTLILSKPTVTAPVPGSRHRDPFVRADQFPPNHLLALLTRRSAEYIARVNKKRRRFASYRG